MKKEISCWNYNITYWFDERDLVKLGNKLLNAKQSVIDEISERYNGDELSKLIESCHRFTLHRDVNYYDSYGGEIEFTLQFYRWETDEEYNKRIEKEEESKKAAELAKKRRKMTIEQRELKTLKKLKEKYEKVLGS